MSVYRRARLGQDVFLGDVVIPLSEIEDTGDSSHGAELRRYTLGRHTVKDKVRLAHLPMPCRARYSTTSFFGSEY